MPWSRRWIACMEPPISGGAHGTTPHFTPVNGEGQAPRWVESRHARAPIAVLPRPALPVRHARREDAAVRLAVRSRNDGPACHRVALPDARAEPGLRLALAARRGVPPGARPRVVVAPARGRPRLALQAAPRREVPRRHAIRGR